MEQSGSAILAATPFDDELESLSREMDKTRIYYGDEKAMLHQEMRKAKAEGIYKAAPASAKASRAMYLASDAGYATFEGKISGCWYLSMHSETGKIQRDCLFPRPKFIISNQADCKKMLF
ncbi:hypothetical protein JW926_00970 [Candidatus Sumerlaeota bacterium]|nr:hypothetical protein [Candidatus Sumerlaeota bacterium]